MRILTGIQPSGTPHLGNYFGAMRQVCDLQAKGESFLFIADYHALTVNPDPEALRRNIVNLALDFIACGVDLDRTLFFRQSAIPQVCELSWILSTYTPMGLLERAHSYKDKLARGFDANAGLFTYPVLMAADILLYRSNLVPVGKDQKQHLEITRDIAIKFNNRFGDVLTIPEGYIPDNVAVVPGTDGQKMSKSYDNIIPIFGSEKEIKGKVMSIVTDCKGLAEPKDPDSCNVFKIYSLVAEPEEVEQMRRNYLGGNYGYGHAKKALFEKLWTKFEGMRARRAELAADIPAVESKLAEHAERAREEAEKTLAVVRAAVGLR
ncbi:MAG: tryptophan--tRNA ligase [Victivallaceae bacterium]|nr:tryptophan--tRNA ligase [Victivallaceae bacterium]